MIKIDINELRKEKIEITIYAEDIDKVIQKKLQHVPPERFEEAKEGLEFSGVQGLYRYCLTGRVGIATPPVEGGCDDWELDFAIIKHERYLERYKEIKTSDQKGHYSGILKNLGYLYKNKKDHRKALEIFKKAKEFDEKHYQPPIFWLKEYEIQINDLEQLLEQKQR